MIKITIQGPAGSGKSRVAERLEAFYLDAGVSVVRYQEGTLDMLDKCPPAAVIIDERPSSEAWDWRSILNTASPEKAWPQPTASHPFGSERLAPWEIHPGVIVRYGDGPTALMKLSDSYVVGWHGAHVLGGIQYASNANISKPSVADLEMCRGKQPGWFTDTRTNYRTSFAVGDKVKKVAGDYQVQGEIVSVFQLEPEKIRYVVKIKGDAGFFAHIFNASQLRKV